MRECVERRFDRIVRESLADELDVEAPPFAVPAGRTVTAATGVGDGPAPLRESSRRVSSCDAAASLTSRSGCFAGLLVGHGTATAIFMTAEHVLRAPAGWTPEL